MKKKELYGASTTSDKQYRKVSSEMDIHKLEVMYGSPSTFVFSSQVYI